MEIFTESGIARLEDDYGPGPERDFMGYGTNPPVVSWPNGERVALSIVINYEEGSEYSIPAGDRRQEQLGESLGADLGPHRDLRTESVHEYGSRAGIWRLARIFDDYAVPVTLSASAVALERNPGVGKWVAVRRHEACAHGWRWSEQWQLSEEEERLRLSATVRSIEQSCGQRPVGWQCRNSASIHTRRLLVEQGGFLYDSDAYNDDVPYFVEVANKRHLVVPYSLTHNDVNYVRGVHASPDDFFATCRAALDYLWEEGAKVPRMMSVGLHPRWSGQPARASAVRNLIEHALEKGDVWIARRRDIASRWWEVFDDADAVRS